MASGSVQKPVMASLVCSRGWRLAMSCSLRGCSWSNSCCGVNVDGRAGILYVDGISMSGAGSRDSVSESSSAASRLQEEIVEVADTVTVSLSMSACDSAASDGATSVVGVSVNATLVVVSTAEVDVVSR